MAKVDERGLEPVDKDRLVLSAGAHGPLAGLGLQSRLVPFEPQQTDFGNEFGDHIGRQTCDPRIAARAPVPTT
ncbi:hypothetical protein [Streptomyces sp. 3211]|uniref:hypothetical protein n=1 Tax=Streptomyces sp. 3211 TaxID=1964449 RepID=UPI0017D5BB7E|nr:hypothetical protein [Streptomyces sp. 3211]